MSGAGQGEAREAGDMPKNETRTWNPPWEGERGHRLPLPELGLAREADHQPGGDVQPRQPEDAAATGARDENLKQKLLPVVTSSLKRTMKVIRAVDLSEMSELLWTGLKALSIQVMFFMILFANIYFSDGLEDKELSGATMAIAVFMFVLPIGIGFAQTFDTLISQTHGSGNMRRVEVLMPRGVLIMCLVSLLCSVPLFYTEYILLCFNQDPDCARLAQTYANYLLYVLPLSFMYQLQVRFLQNQNIFLPQMLTGVIGCCITYILINVQDIIPPAAASAIAHFFLVVILLHIMKCQGFLKTTQKGLFLDTLQEWRPFCTDAFCSVAMLCIKYWQFATYFVVTSLNSKVELQVLTAVGSMYIPAIMVSRGLAAAASVRVGNALGACDVMRAKRSMDYAIINGVLFAGLCAGLMSAFADNLWYTFRDDEEALKLVDEYFLRFCCTCGADTFATILEGVARGMGQLRTSAAVICGCHILGIIISLAMIYREMYFLGPWFAVTFGLALSTTLLYVVLHLVDVQKFVNDAQERAGVLSRDDMAVYKGPWQALKVQPAQDQGTTGDDKPAQLVCTTVVGNVLSVKQLLVRRGLVSFFVVAIVLGFAVHRYTRLCVLGSITFENDSLSTALPHLEH